MSLQQVETRRIAALLKVPSPQLAFLEACPPAALTKLRKRITAAGMERHRKTFERLSRVSGLMPAPIAARIARDVLGPEIVAQLTPFMAVDRAVSVSKQLPISFQADVSIHMVPESSSELLAALPHEVRRAVTRELLARGEYAVMGSVVDFLPVTVIPDLAREIQEPDALLEITAYVEDKSRLQRVVEDFPDARIAELLQSARATGRMVVLCELVAAVDQANQRRLRPLLGARGAELHDAWTRAWEGAGLGADPWA